MTVKIHSMHGKIQRAVDYITDPAKCEHAYIRCHDVPDHAIAGTYWDYRHHRERGTSEVSRPITGYHLIMSFPPDCGIQEQKCLDLAEEWMRSLFDGEYSYVISVHQDTPHMHAHIIVDPYSLLDGHKLHMDFKTFIPQMKEEADRIWTEHGLAEYVIDGKGNPGKQYYEWMQGSRSYKATACAILDSLCKKCANVEDLALYLLSIGIELQCHDLDPQGLLSGVPEKRPEQFRFSIHGSKCREDGEDQITFVLPGTRGKILAAVPASCLVKETEQSRFFEVDLDRFSRIEFYETQDPHFPLQLSFEEFKSHLDEKARTSLSDSILLPVSPRPIRLRRLTGARGERYSLDDLKERIAANGKQISDPMILEQIRRYRQARLEEGFDQGSFIETSLAAGPAAIPYEESRYKLVRSKKDGYYWYQQKQQQALQDRIDQTSRLLSTGIGRPRDPDGLREQLKTIKADYHAVSELLNDSERIYADLLADLMEGRLEITERQMKEWIDETIRPLQTQRTALKAEYARLTHEIKKMGPESSR